MKVFPFQILPGHLKDSFIGRRLYCKIGPKAHIIGIRVMEAYPPTGRYQNGIH